MSVRRGICKHTRARARTPGAALLNPPVHSSSLRAPLASADRSVRVRAAFIAACVLCTVAGSSLTAAQRRGRSSRAPPAAAEWITYLFTFPEWLCVDTSSSRRLSVISMLTGTATTDHALICEQLWLRSRLAAAGWTHSWSAGEGLSATNCCKHCEGRSHGASTASAFYGTVRTFFSYTPCLAFVLDVWLQDRASSGNYPRFPFQLCSRLLPSATCCLWSSVCPWFSSQYGM